jgi:arsenate reductase
MPVTLYHNPRCRKSRETLALIQERGIEPRVVEYLEHPPTVAELKVLLRQLGLSARELLRSKEPEYKKAGLDNPALSDEAILKAMVKYPKLIERPIVVNGKKAALGRPPENALKVL